MCSFLRYMQIDEVVVYLVMFEERSSLKVKSVLVFLLKVKNLIFPISLQQFKIH